MANTSEMLQKMALCSNGKKVASNVEEKGTEVDKSELTPPDLPLLGYSTPAPSLGDVLKQCLASKKDDLKLR
ncbi:Uncharacterised protein (plasmid) [Legionella adelaidensis]|uniref:Uncharacterized protein n=1 Tax=Legionella adelaidensis TaxID=45056 RepID=A0A0W0R622_9GAMM|nr:hypothetical protein [Legionella adelaidensis]KTC66545.1 hypothetical protein Lade_1203 [Legionella adelaidensis]VEH81167.1 Uncharacterised protein [Legionella adelaidensis]